MTPRILYFTVFPLVWIACWVLVAGVSFEARGMVVSSSLGDEAEILSIAWTMWRDSTFLSTWSDVVSADATYPMIYWIINLGWALFGVSDWWPHVVGYGAGLSCVFLTAGLARILWPGWAGLGAMSGTGLSAMAVWIAFAGVLGPLMIAAAFVIAAFYALVWTWRTGRWDGFFYYGLAVGACVLTIGPFAWAVGVPVALLTPLWGGALAEQIDEDRSPPAGWRQWYTGVLAGTVFSIAMIVGWLAWLFAGDLATPEFLLAQYGAPLIDLFSDQQSSSQQTSGQPWWLLLIVFNCMALPWALWAPAWRSLAGVVQLVRDGGARLCMIWMASVVVPVITVPGMNAPGLLLALPALSLVIAFLVFCRADVEGGSKTSVSRGESAIGLVLVVLGSVAVVAPYSDA
ncbi:MAG: hypothetical protein HN644_02785, partial [Rhodospirillales bacterium]|nr:hypothetical protein [Rhodospirillales bacterium]